MAFMGGRERSKAVPPEATVRSVLSFLTTGEIVDQTGSKEADDAADSSSFHTRISLGTGLTNHPPHRGVDILLREKEINSGERRSDVQ